MKGGAGERGLEGRNAEREKVKERREGVDYTTVTLLFSIHWDVLGRS